MNRYEMFERILKTMHDKNYDYTTHESPDKIIERKNGRKFTIEEHISSLVYAELSNQRPWKPIADNMDKINEIFHNFDPEYIKNTPGEEFEGKIREIKCGNRQIKNQMKGLKDNVVMFEKITEDYGSPDKFVTSDEPEKIARILTEGKYKMKGLGPALSLEYLKGVGIDTVKPDVHIRRLFGRVGIAGKEMASEKEVIEIVHDISSHFGMLNMEVDSVLWQYCAKDYLEICGAEPDCLNCGLNGECEFSEQSHRQEPQ